MEPWDQTGLPGSSASGISLCYWLGTASSQCNRTSERFADCTSAHVVQMGGLAALDLCYSAMTIGPTWTSQSSHSPSEEHTYCLMKACPTLPLPLHWHRYHDCEDSSKKDSFFSSRKERMKEKRKKSDKKVTISTNKHRWEKLLDTTHTPVLSSFNDSYHGFMCRCVAASSGGVYYSNIQLYTLVEIFTHSKC